MILKFSVWYMYHTNIPVFIKGLYKTDNERAIICLPCYIEFLFWTHIYSILYLSRLK